MPLSLLQKIFLVLLRDADVVDSLDAAYLKYRAFGAGRARSPADSHFVPYMSGEALGRKAVGLQIRDWGSRLFVHQNIQAVLLIHTTGQRRRLGLRRRLLLLRRLLF